MKGCVECWEGLVDPRIGNAGLHDVDELLTIALCTVLCGDQSAVDMVLFARAATRSMVAAPRRMPCATAQRSPATDRSSVSPGVATFASPGRRCGVVLDATG